MNDELIQTVLGSTVLRNDPTVRCLLQSYNDGHFKLSSEAMRQVVLDRHDVLQPSELDGPVDYDALQVKLRLTGRPEYTLATWSSITAFARKMKRLFPDYRYALEYRIADSEEFAIKLQTNGSRAYFDTIGFRVIPKHSLDFIKAILLIERNLGKVLFRINTYQFCKQDYQRLIGPNSSTSYRAVHYYVWFGTEIVEIQLRTPHNNIWSNLHHVMMYKPNRTYTADDCAGILALGEIANIIDYAELLAYTDH